MDDILAGLLIAVFSFFAGMFFGGAAIETSLQKNCEQIEAFRVGDKVYECHLKAKP